MKSEYNVLDTGGLSRLLLVGVMVYGKCWEKLVLRILFLAQ